MAMVAGLALGWCMAACGAGEEQVYLPGTWAPVEVGIVRRDTPGEEEWTGPQLMVVLDWQPAGGRSINELPADEYARVLNAAFSVFSRRSETLVLADNEPLEPHTIRAWRGYKRLHMYFALPEAIPEKLELFIRQASYALGTFEASGTLSGGKTGQFTIDDCTWRLDRVEPGRTPPRMPEDLPDLAPEIQAMTAFTGPCPETDQALKMTFVGDRSLGDGNRSLWFDGLVLRSGDQQWKAAAADIAQSGAPGALPYLVMWFPIAPEALPDECELIMSGTTMTVDREAVEETIYELPSPWVGA